MFLYSLEVAEAQEGGHCIPALLGCTRGRTMVDRAIHLVPDGCREGLEVDTFLGTTPRAVMS